MKLILESWRKYLLTEVSIKDAMVSLQHPSNPVKKAILRYMEQNPLHDEEEVSADRFEKIKNRFIKYIDPRSHAPHAPLGQGRLIPNDLETENQKAQAVMWLTRLIKKEQDTTTDDSFIKKLIEPGGFSEPAQVELRNNIETFFRYKHLMEPNALDNIDSIQKLGLVVQAAAQDIEAYEERREKKDPTKIIDGTIFYLGGWDKETSAQIKEKAKVGEEGKKFLFSNPPLETIPGRGGYVVMVVTNLAASCYHGKLPGGKPSKFCTAHDPRMFARYGGESEEDPLFIFQLKDLDSLELLGQSPFQFNYGRQEFMNNKNEPLSRESQERLHKILTRTEAYKKYAVLRRYDLNNMVASNSTASFKEVKAFIDSLPEEERRRWLPDIAGSRFGVKPETLIMLAGKEYEDITEIAYKLVNNPKTPTVALQYLAQKQNNRYGSVNKRARKELSRRMEPVMVQPAAPSPLQEYFVKFLK